MSDLAKFKNEIKKNLKADYKFPKEKGVSKFFVVSLLL